MSQQELLIRVIRALEEIGVDYMVTGSFASSLQGEPRSTHDIDILVTIQKNAIGGLVSAFPSPDFYLNETSVLDALDRQTMFNLIDVREGYKIDFWMLKDEPFDRSRFSRRYVEEIMGVGIQISSPEDTILAKLNWAKKSGGSEKQFVDALRVYEVQFAELDIDYMEHWVRKLGMEPLWRRLRHEAEVL